MEPIILAACIILALLLLGVGSAYDAQAAHVEDAILNARLLAQQKCARIQECWIEKSGTVRDVVHTDSRMRYLFSSYFVEVQKFKQRAIGLYCRLAIAGVVLFVLLLVQQKFGTLKADVVGTTVGGVIDCALILIAALTAIAIVSAIRHLTRETQRVSEAGLKHSLNIKLATSFGQILKDAVSK